MGRLSFRQTLLTMYDPTHMQMVATVRESLAMRLKVGQEIPARLDTLDTNCHATISEIVPEAQAESRSFQVKVTGPCPPNVYSGMFGRIFIPLEDEEVLVVPPGGRAAGRAARRGRRRRGRDAVSRRAVQLGRTLDEGREVLSGLERGRAGRRARGRPPAAGRRVMSQHDTGTTRPPSRSSTTSSTGSSTCSSTTTSRSS